MKYCKNMHTTISGVFLNSHGTGGQTGDSNMLHDEKCILYISTIYIMRFT